MKNRIRKIITGCAILVSHIAAITAQESRPNILFIAVDDLRTELGCYGVDQIITPNIDRLASKGTVFKRAYCQQAVCSPSRTSLMTGLRPDKTKVYDLHTHFRSTIPDAITIPQYFKRHGYYTRGFGKIYHGLLDDPLSWSEQTDILKKLKLKVVSEENSQFIASNIGTTIAEAEKNRSKGLSTKSPPAYVCNNLPDSLQGDGKLAYQTVKLLKDPKMKESPFFLAVGFRKPHLPFIAPKKYWDYYNPEKIDKANNPFYPKNVPEIALTSWGELRRYQDIPQKGPLSAEQAKKLKHGYYACVSMIDSFVGMLMNTLEEQGLAENTIVILWGDHGWKLGEHNMWCKHTNFEIDTNAPLICYSPNQKKNGTQTNALVEFVDIFPTLCELAGLPIPEQLQGKSFVPLLDQPGKKWKEAVFSQFPRPGGIMGYSMRTDRYRFNLWFDKEKNVIAKELYDHKIDPEENENVVNDLKYKTLLKRYSMALLDQIEEYKK